MSENKPKVLIIDDNETVIKVIKIHLNSVGYETLIAKNGEEGLKILSENEPAVVICDIRMDKMSGIEVLKHIKEKYEKLPVIMHSGSIDEDMKGKVKSLGAYAFLGKPIRRNQLISVIEEAIKKSQSQ